eukprot:813188-Alexandrium_andersonii.AAC.1
MCPVVVASLFASSKAKVSSLTAALVRILRSAAEHHCMAARWSGTMSLINGLCGKRNAVSKRNDAGHEDGIWGRTV